MLNLPGLYPGAIATIERMDAELRALRVKVASMDRGADDRFPALITDSDDGYDPVRMIWREQDYDKNGLRVTRQGGRTGTAIQSPAFAVGGGTLPATGAWGDGVEVELRRRDVAEDADDPGKPLGPVYEFDWPDTAGGGTISIVATFQPSPDAAVGSGGSKTYTAALSLDPGLYLITGTVQMLAGSTVIGGFVQLQGSTQKSPRYYFYCGAFLRVCAVPAWVVEVTGSTEAFDLFVFSDGGAFTVEQGTGLPTSTNGTTLRTTQLS